MTQVVVADEVATQVVIEEENTVVSIPDETVTVVAEIEQGAPGTPAPDIRYWDFYKKGPFLGPYHSPMRRYVEKAGTVTRVQANVDSQPVGSPVVIDVLKNGVSIYPGGVGRPSIAPLTNVALGGIGVAVQAGDYFQVDIVSGAAADLTVSLDVTS